MLAAKIDTEVAPLSTDETGTIRVGKTRVRLDSVVYAFNQGHTPEEILMQFPTLDLADIYSVIAYYLNNQAAVDEYIQQNAAEGNELRRTIESQSDYQAFRQKLLASRTL
jgi:uncharacterized protein (DUF433 family)